MAKLSASDVHAYAVRAGLGAESAITAVAIAMAESGLDTAAVGDVSLQDSTWGPSIGLWQIRSLKAEKGTGRARDASRLKDPAFNARSMATISAGGTNWSPWTKYKNGAYRGHLAAARAGAGKGPTSQLSAPVPTSGQVGVQNTGHDLDPLPGGSGAPGYGDDLFGWVTGKAGDAVMEKAVAGIVYTTVFGLAVALVAIGAWRAVT